MIDPFASLAAGPSKPVAAAPTKVEDDGFGDFDEGFGDFEEPKQPP